MTFISGSPTAIATCPAVIASTNQASGIPVGFLYTITSSNMLVCGAGTLSCSQYGSNEFSCQTLFGGTQYNYVPSTGALTSYALSNPTQCYSYGDGFLPLDQEGISFGGAFPQASNANGFATNCTSIFAQPGGGFGINYNSITGPVNFVYNTGQLSYGDACGAFIPNLGTPAALQTGFGCGGAGYDLTSISQQDLVFISGTTYYELNPCFYLTTGLCAGRNASFCRVTSGSGSGTIASYLSETIEVVQWLPITGGIQSRSLNGDGCTGSSYGPSLAIVQYLCNATATRPVISSVTYTTTGGPCTYTAVVQTAAVCGTPLPPLTPGLPFTSNTCGGGAYNLTALDSVDTVFNVPTQGTYFYRPCSNVTTGTCSGTNSPTSYCQYGLYSLSYGAATNSTTYTVLPNNAGLLIQIQDGTSCNGYFPRETNTYLMCNYSALTPYVSSFGEALAGASLTTNTLNYCHYTTVIQTAVVCPIYSGPAAFTNLCIIFFGLPGNVDYPWSSAISMNVFYNPNTIATSFGPAVLIINGTGTRTYTNRFGISTVAPFTIYQNGTFNSDNLLYLTSPYALDNSGLVLVFGQPVQLPGGGPLNAVTYLTVANSTGGIVEFGSQRIDRLGTGVVSGVPGFINQTIGASNVNSLAPVYSTCAAPISFTNGLRTPTQPSVSNGGMTIQYNYLITDGVTYTVQTNLTMTAVSGFASTKDVLGNPYQTIVAVSGSRLYSYITGTSVLSNITGLSTVNGADNRFYPYSFLASSPGVYTINTAPFLDVSGIGFTISPPAPQNGLPPGALPTFSALSVYFSAPLVTSYLIESNFFTAPNPSLQQQQYSFM